jgi:hypothetical protein
MNGPYAGVGRIEPDSSGFPAEGGIRPGVYAGFGGRRLRFQSNARGHVSRVQAAPAAATGSKEPGEPG